MLFLKSILKCCPNLERFALLEDFEDENNDSTSTATRPSSILNHSHDLEDSLLQFVSKMRRLICCFITFDRINASLSKRVNRQIAKRVIPYRPSLWFFVGSFTPEEDPNMPLIHYLEMIDSTYYFSPPTFWNVVYESFFLNTIHQFGTVLQLIHSHHIFLYYGAILIHLVLYLVSLYSQ